MPKNKKSETSQAKTDLEIVYRPVDWFQPYAKNPRRNDAAVDRMVASIKEFGFKVPVLARGDGTVVDGHLRIKAARKLGLTELPVILCDEWTDAQVKAFRLMANKSVSWAEWDEELLNLELLELKDLDFDLGLTGFDADDLTRIMYGKAIPEPDAKESIVPDGGDNVIARLSFPASVWLGKREEIMEVFGKMERAYLCTVRVDE
ncbi:MAG: ParB N-terminal domain-containing protein [bacterium]